MGVKIVLSGASGFVGRYLSAGLEDRGHLVVKLVRRAADEERNEVRWDPASGELDPAVLSGADAVVNLNGRNISQGRWSDAVKRELRSSRLDSTRTIAAAVGEAAAPPPLLVNASATGFYGDRGDEELDEASAQGGGFLADLCREWEEAALAATSAATRVAVLRLGIVLGSGGALAKMLPPFKLGLGGPIGNGRQYWPWITLDDVVGAIDHILGNASIHGPVNLVAPEARTSASFARDLGKQLGRPAVLPAPAFAVKLALGEMAEALLLASTLAVPGVLQQTGYEFRAPTLAAAFRSILG
jgi:uncharacterized protein (TIGR01777 family)